MFEVIQHIDLAVLIFINRKCENKIFDFLCPILRDKMTWIPLYLGVLIFFIRKEKWKTIVWVLAALFAITLTDQLGLFIKKLVQRVRPCSDNEVAELIHLKIAHCSQQFSFISNHAANHFAQATLYSFIFKNSRATLFFFMWAFVVSFSQIYVGVHYPTDVFGGAMIGSIIGFLTFYIFSNLNLYLNKRKYI